MKKVFLFGMGVFFLILITSCIAQERFKEENLDVSFSKETLEACNLLGIPDVPFTSSYLVKEDKLYFNCKEIKSWYIDLLTWIEAKEDIIFWGSFIPAQYLLFTVTVDKYEELEEYILPDNSLHIAFTTMDFLNNSNNSFQNCFVVNIVHLDESKKIKSKDTNYYFWYEMRVYEHSSANMFHPPFGYKVEE